jgi:hypothetical protein
MHLNMLMSPAMGGGILIGASPLSVFRFLRAAVLLSCGLMSTFDVVAHAFRSWRREAHTGILSAGFSLAMCRVYFQVAKPLYRHISPNSVV